MKPSKVIITGALILASATLGFSAFNKSLTPYVGFREAKAASGSVQVSGEVIHAQVQYDARTGTLKFPLKDHTGEMMNVVAHGGKPNNFDQAPQIVAIGRCENGIFQADSLLTKCPSKYETEKGPKYKVQSSGFNVQSSEIPNLEPGTRNAEPKRGNG